MSQVIGSAGGQVVSLMQFKNAEHFHLLNEVESYWEALRDGAVLPYRDQIDPRGLERALDNIFYIEKLGPGALRFRLTGKLIEELLGMDPRSMPFASLFDGEDREEMRRAVDTAMTRPQVLRMRLVSEARSGRQALSSGLAIFPLRDSQPSVTKALGCLQVGPSADLHLRRFSIRSMTVRNLTAPAQKPEKMPPLIEEAFTAFNEDPASFEPRQSKPGKAPNLRVIKS